MCMYVFQVALPNPDVERQVRCDELYCILNESVEGTDGDIMNYDLSMARGHNDL